MSEIHNHPLSKLLSASGKKQSFPQLPDGGCYGPPQLPDGGCFGPLKPYRPFLPTLVTPYYLIWRILTAQS